MKIICVETEEEMSARAASLIGGLVAEKKDAVLGLATGSTPMGTYALLIRMYLEGRLDFSKVRTVNLDEYVGLDGHHPQSYRAFMEEHFFQHINISLANTYVPNGVAEDIDHECRSYDERLERLGFCDLQLLGIGENGHIGFNEPAGHFTPECHCIELTENTIAVNSRFFDSPEEVPRLALTLGMRGILSARRLLLLAFGKKKAKAIAGACFGPVTPRVPGSVIQLHPDVTVIADREALSMAPQANQPCAPN